MGSLSKSFKTISEIFFFSILLITIPAISQSAVYSSADTPIFHPGGTTITSDIVIADSGGLEDLNVTLDITNTYDSDLVITLKAPDGTNIQLVNRRGGGGDNFTNTVLDDEAGSAISSGSAPFTGSFRPEMPLSLLDGKSITGTWELKIVDLVSFDSGILDSWSMDVTASSGGDSGGGTVYNSTDVPIGPVLFGVTTSDIVVADSGYLTDVNVTFDISHPYISDLIITLKAPDATSVQLVNRRGGSGSNFTGTTVDDETSVSITTGTAPFAGSYTPEALLSSLDGKSITGTWVLEVFDPISNDFGTLNSWSVELQFADPLADDGTLVTDEDVPGSDTLSATDSGGDSLTYSVVSNGAEGTAVIDDSATGAYTYTPDADYFGSDSFTFQVIDSNSDTSNTATISITVNPVSDDPIATNGVLAFDEDTVGAGTLSASDADRDRITYSLVTAASYGTVVVDTTTGSFTYTQDTEHWFGADYFTFQVMDSYGVYSNIATVDITVNSVNDDPVAVGDTLSAIDEDAVGLGTLSGSDPVEGDSITYSLDTDATYGSVVVISTGAYTYTPDTDWSGVDSFTFVVTDSNGGASDPATIDLTVNPLSDDPVTTSDVDGVYDYNWSVTMNGTDVVYSRSVATDSSGNAYVVGEFEQTVDFDSSIGVDEYTSAGWRDIFLTKINADSSYGWTIAIGSDSYDIPYDVAVDLTSNVYMVGTFSNTVDFNPMGAGDEQGAYEESYGFITKRFSDGSYGWTKSFNSVVIADVVTDSSDSVYFTGRFMGTVDFNAGAGTDEFVSDGFRDGFVTKLNPDGSYGWTKVYTGTGASSVSSLVIDEDGNVIVAGSFTGTEDFDPGAGTAEHTSTVVDKRDTFVVKLDSSGVYSWSIVLAGSNTNYPASVGVDSGGNVFVGGNFWDTVDFDPTGGVDEYTSEDAYDMFITAINSDGSYGWTNVIGAVSSQSLNDLIVSGDDIFIAGGFWYQVDFDPTGGTDLRSPYGNPYPSASEDVFISKLKTDGSYSWTKTTGGIASDAGHGLSIDGEGNLFLTGVYSLTDADLNPSIESDWHTNVGSYDSFLTKFSYNVTSLTIDEDTPIDGILSGSDADGDSLTYSIVGVASNGTVTILDSATGEFSYTPDVDYNGSDSFTFQVIDSNSNTSNISSVTINILPVNDAPSAVSEAVFFDEDVVGVGTVSASDAESDSFDFTLIDGPYFGILTFNTTTGDYSYTQAIPDWYGVDYFSFTATDSNGATSDVAAINLTIDPVNIAPVTTSDILEAYDWTVTMGSTGNEGGDNGGNANVAVDSSGNVFIAGTFWSSADFDPGAGEDIHTTAGGYGAFLTKMNSDGSYGWTKTFEGSGFTEALDVAVDLNGNAFVSGYFWSTFDFDPSAGTDDHTSNGSGDAFVTKIYSDGSYGWTNTFGGTYSDHAEAVGVDSSGNVYIAGTFRDDTVDFDPGVGVDEILSLGESGFLTKFSSDGSYEWTKAFRTIDTVVPRDIAFGLNDEVYVTGGFKGNVGFNYGGFDFHLASGFSDIFLTKIMSDGSYGWTKSIGDTGTDRSNSVATDSSGNIFITGYFGGTVNFDTDGGSDDHLAVASSDGFITKINSNGSYGWTKTFGGSSDDEGLGIALDSSDDIYIAGRFNDTVDFNLGAGGDNHTSLGFYDIFLTKLYNDGSYGWTKTAGSTNYDEGIGVAVDLSGNIFLSGIFIGTVDFDFEDGVDNHISLSGTRDIFLTKLSSDSAVLNVLEDSPKTGTLSATDADYVDMSAYFMTDLSDSLIYSVVTPPSYGTVVILDSTLGSFTYTPDANYFGADSFTFKVNDGTADSNISTITVDVISVNDIPVAVDGALPAIDEDTIGAGTVTVSGADVEGDSIVFSLVTDASYGTVVITSTSGDYTYTPDPYWNGSDFFTFQAIDSSGGYSSPATIDLTVNSVNDDPIASGGVLVTDEDVQGAGSLIATDDDGDSLTYSLVADASYGTVVVTSSTGSYTYTQDTQHWNGSDFFTFQVMDSYGVYSNIATINVTVNSVNDAPVATSDMTSLGWIKSFTPAGVFPLDTKTDSKGNIYISGYMFPGTFDFDPGLGEDLHGSGSNVRGFLTKINSNYSYGGTMSFATSVTGIAIDSDDNVFISGRFSGTVDFDPGSGFYNITSFGMNGFMSKFNAEGEYLWTTSYGQDFDDDYAYDIAMDSNGNISLVGLFDVGGGSSNYRVLKVSPADGSIIWKYKLLNGWPANSVAVDSNDNVYVVEDSSIYKLDSDGFYLWSKSTGGAVAVAVDQAGGVFVASGTGINAKVVRYTQLSGLTSWTTNLGTTVKGVEVDLNGDIIVTGAGYIKKLRASDGAILWSQSASGSLVEATMDETGNVYATGNDSSGGYIAKIEYPIDTLILYEDTAASATLSATDADGDPLVYSFVGLASNGTLSWINSTLGTFTYTPDADYFGSDSFTFKVNDGTVDSNVSEITVSVISVNDAPVASSAALPAFDEDTVGAGILSVTDIEGDSLTYSLVADASYGTVVITSTTGDYIYNPDQHWNGTDFFTFQAMDSYGVYSNIATITIDVIAVNDQFTLAANDINTYQNTHGTSQIAITDPDLVDTYTYSVITIAGSGTVSVDTSGLITYMPNTDYVGGDSFEVEVTDSGGLTDTVTISVTVTAVDSAPPVDGAFNIVSGNAYNALSWSGFTDDLGDISYTVVMETGTFTPSTTCSSGVTVYSGSSTSYNHVNLLNGTTYNYRLCATDTAGNTSVGLTGTAIPSAPSDGISFAGDDANANGLVRGDGGSDGNNLDTGTGKPMSNPGFEFKIVVQDTVSGAAPLSVRLFVEDRATPGTYTPYDMTCSGDYTEGLLCSYSTLLGAFSSGSYYFEVVLGDITPTVWTSATFQMPLVNLLKGYALVGVARDIDASSLVATHLGCSDPNSVYRWVSSGLSKKSGNKGAYALVDGVSPLKTGEGYFLDTTTCGDVLPELEGKDDTELAYPTAFNIILQAGWNIVSNPYNGNVMLSDIEVQKDGEEPMEWTDAVTGGVVVNGIYYYDGSDWGYTYTMETAGGTPDAKLAPWVGYWLYLKKDDGVYQLIVPKP